MDLGGIDAICQWQGFVVDACATDDEDHIIPGIVDGVLQGVCDVDTAGVIVEIFTQYDILSPWKWATNTLVCPAPHDQRVAHGKRLEARLLGGQMPWQFVAMADDPIFGYCIDQRDRLHEDMIACLVLAPGGQSDHTNGMQTDIVLKAHELIKTYGKKENTFMALKGVSLEIRAGESVAIIGKSGSGKSTLMHILAALDRPDSGLLELGGKNVESLKDSKLDVLRNREFGFIFQQFFLNYRETVLENVMLPLKIAGLRAGERKRRAKEALAEVDLTNKANNKASDLSGGQKQRVCIARALVSQPRVIFADEPTGNLDSENGQRVEDLLFGLNKQKGITLIIVTHDEDLAAKCSRRLYMKDGMLTEEGEHDEAVRSHSHRKPKLITL